MSRHLPAALLVVVAVLQVSLVHRSALSAWKGGGFGMFSTLDSRAHRVVRIRVDAPNRSEQLVVPVSLEPDAAAAETLPTTARLDRLGRAVAARERRHGRMVDSVHLEVWRTDFEPTRLVPTARRIASHVVRLEH